jgi:hypothetical protein
LGKNLGPKRVICNTCPEERSTILNNPFTEKVAIFVPLGFTAKLTISSSF